MKEYCLYAYLVLTLTGWVVPQAAGQVNPLFSDIAAKNPGVVYREYPGAYRALPGVYRVHVSGKSSLKSPRSVTVDVAQLKKDVQTARKSGELPADMSDSAIGWLSLAINPAAYLRASDEFSTTTKDGALGYGTAFAIDRDGILVTNRHVIAEKADEPLGMQGTLELAPESFKTLINDLIAALGPWQGSDRDGTQILNVLADWYGSHARLSIVDSKIEVAVAFVQASVTEQSAQRSAIDMAIKAFGDDARKPVLVPAKVIAKSGSGMSNDLALLKIEVVIRDALICVPLTSKIPNRGDRAFSLGYPVYRYDMSRQRSVEHSDVNVNPGRFTWLPKQGELSIRDRATKHVYELEGDDADLTLLSATIRGGASGGPVVLEDGTVAAVNVGYRSLPTDGQPKPSGTDTQRFFQEWILKQRSEMNFAVSLDRLGAFLEENKINPDPGPTTRDWLAAMDAYARRDEATALKLLDQIDRRQYCTRLAPDEESGKPDVIKQRIVSHYVEELREQLKNRVTQSGAAAGAAFPWQTSVFDAFVSAVENNRPLVVLVVDSDLTKEGSVSAAFLKEWEADGLGDLRTRAVFVKVAYNVSDGTSPDEKGRTMLSHLDVRSTPAVLIIAPTTVKLVEVYHREGACPMAEVREELSKGFQQALDPNLLSAP